MNLHDPRRQGGIDVAKERGFGHPKNHPPKRREAEREQVEKKEAQTEVGGDQIGYVICEEKGNTRYEYSFSHSTSSGRIGTPVPGDSVVKRRDGEVVLRRKERSSVQEDHDAIGDAWGSSPDEGDSESTSEMQKNKPGMPWNDCE